MKSVLTAMLTCAVLFGISFFATSAMRSPEEPSEETTETEGSPVATPAENTDQDNKGMVKTMPVSLRPDNAVTVEAVLQMSNSIKQMEQELALREERVAKKEQRVNMMLEDLTTEQDELRAFTEGIDAKIEVLSQLSTDVNAKLDSLETKQTELQKLEKSTGTDDDSKQQEFDDKVNLIKGWFENLPPQQAAELPEVTRQHRQTRVRRGRAAKTCGSPKIEDPRRNGRRGARRSVDRRFESQTTNRVATNASVSPL